MTEESRPPKVLEVVGREGYNQSHRKEEVGITQSHRKDEKGIDVSYRKAQTMQSVGRPDSCGVKGGRGPDSMKKYVTEW